MSNLFRILILFMFILSACTPSQTAHPTPTVTFSTRIPLPVTATLPPLTRLSLQPSASPTMLPGQPVHTEAPTSTPFLFPTNTITPTPGNSPTPSVPMAFKPGDQPVPCYFGPGIEYNQELQFDIPVEIIGEDEGGGWWYIRVPREYGDYTHCWVGVNKVVTGGDLSPVVIIEPPTARITTVSISSQGQLLDPTSEYSQTINCGAEKPVLHFSGRIQTNGPVNRVKALWETNAPGNYPLQQVRISSWDDPAEIKLDVAVPAQAGSYFLRLRTLYPNEMSSTVQFAVQCE